jgi:hypothetical protein
LGSLNLGRCCERLVDLGGFDWATIFCSSESTQPSIAALARFLGEFVLALSDWVGIHASTVVESY